MFRVIVAEILGFIFFVAVLSLVGFSYAILKELKEHRKVAIEKKEAIAKFLYQEANRRAERDIDDLK